MIYIDVYFTINYIVYKILKRSAGNILIYIYIFNDFFDKILIIDFTFHSTN